MFAEVIPRSLSCQCCIQMPLYLRTSWHYINTIIINLKAKGPDILPLTAYREIRTAVVYNVQCYMLQPSSWFILVQFLSCAVRHRRSQEFVLRGRGPDNWGAKIEKGRKWGRGCPPSRQLGLGKCRKVPQRGSGQSPGRKRVLEYLELEKKTHLIATNLSYLTFLRHIFSHIHTHNY